MTSTRNARTIRPTRSAWPPPLRDEPRNAAERPCPGSRASTIDRVSGQKPLPACLRGAGAIGLELLRRHERGAAHVCRRQAQDRAAWRSRVRPGAASRRTDGRAWDASRARCRPRRSRYGQARYTTSSGPPRGIARNGRGPGVALDSGSRRSRSSRRGYRHGPDATRRRQAATDASDVGPDAIAALKCNNPGDDLFSRKAALSVSSALESLTSVFGMGTGVASPLESPGSYASGR